MTTAASLSEIKVLLQANALSLAMQLAPLKGKRSGKWWVACNPTRADDNPSLGIAVAGNAPGAWVDFATGDKGDILKLIQYCEGLADLKATLQWARAWLGLDGAPAPALKQKLHKAKADADARSRDAEQTARDNATRAKGTYLAARKLPFVGSVAAQYLATRGLNISELARVPGCLGWLPDMRHAETKTVWPVMVAAFTNADNQTVAIHRTFLRPDGSGKAPVVPARKIWPAFTGSAIRLWRGDSGLSIDAADKQGLRETLVLVEGVEDGLAIALSCPDKRVWCAGSLANLSEIVLPACIDDVVVCADNDWGKPQAEKLLRRALDHLARQGRTVRVARSPVGKDVNDALIGGAV